MLLILAGCGRDSTPPTGSSSATSAPASTTTPSPPSTAKPQIAIPSLPPQGVGAGDRGEHVRAVEAGLAALQFDVGPVDDVFDDNTTFAVQAFQKLAGLPATAGSANPSSRASTPPSRRLPW